MRSVEFTVLRKITLTISLWAPDFVPYTLAMYSRRVGAFTTIQKAFSIVICLLVSSVMADITTGLMGKWSFENSTADASGSNNNGTAVGGSVYTTGTNGYALSNSSTRYVDIGTGAALAITNQLTLAAWVYCNGPYTATAPSNRHTVIGRFSGTGYILDLIDGTGQLRFYVDGTTPSSPSGVPLNTWTHVAGTYNGTTITVFVNGVSVATGSKTLSTIPVTGNLLIGARSDSTAVNFLGKIDEAYMFRRALSSTEIVDLINSSLAPPPIMTNVFLFGKVSSLRGSPLQGVLIWQSNVAGAGGAYSLGDGTFTLPVPQFTNVTITLSAPKGTQVPVTATNISTPLTNFSMNFAVDATGDATTFRSSSMYSPSLGDLQVEILRTTDATERVILNLVSATGSTKWRLYDSSVTGKANVLSMPGSALNRLVTTGTYILEMKIVPLSSYEDDPRNTVVRKMLIIGR